MFCKFVNSPLVRALVLASAAIAGGCTVSPEGIDRADMALIASDKLSRVTSDQEPLPKVVDLYEAIARALKYNLDHQVEIAEHALRQRELDLAHFSLLPNAVASSGYAARDNYNASTSINVFTNQPSLAMSTSQEKQINSADVAFSWNILDFGLSYIRARQAADKVLIQNELRRKITLRIMEDVRSAYWRAVSAQRMLDRIARVEAQARDVERDARSLYAEQKSSAITALTYEREIVEIQRTLGELQRELNTAKAQLGALMNVRPGTKFRVAESHSSRPVPPVGGNIADLIHQAVTNRPELREVEYRKRINEHEAHAALLELLPGIQLIAGSNFDGNAYLLNSHWINWGARASWNVMKVFSHQARRDVIDQQDELLERKALAVTMAIMTQVYVSRVRYAHAVKEYKTATRYRDVQHNLLAQIRQEASAGRVSSQTLVREELNALVAEVKLDLAYAASQSAYANVKASIGLDPQGVDFDGGISVRELAQLLRRPSRASWNPRMAEAR